MSSLSHTFVFGIRYVRIPIRLAFAFALHFGFLNRMSQPLGAIDILSTACHPSQTVHQPVSLEEVSDVIFDKWCYIVA